jgi:hypothetical protein
MLSRTPPATTLGVLALLLGNAFPATTEVVERIVAVVDGHPLMLTEALLVERVLGVDRKTALDAAIDERLMYREASRLPQAAVTDEEEGNAYTSLVARAAGRAEGLPEAELRLMARRQAVILKYGRFRFLPQIRIEDEAARNVSPEERQRLVDRELGEKIEAWIRELRGSAAVRYNP